MEYADVMLAINPAPLWAIGGIVVAFILFRIIGHVRSRLANRETEDMECGAVLDAGPRREAIDLIDKLSALRDEMKELDLALTRCKEGVRWQVGIGQGDNGFFRNADSDVNAFLSATAERDLSAAQGEMISLFRGAAKWLKKYAPREVPPPSLRKRAADAFRTFLCGLFPALKRTGAQNIIPVVRKTKKNESRTEDDPPEKVADDDAWLDEILCPVENPKSREKLRIPLDLLDAGKAENLPDAALLRQNAKRLADLLRTYNIDAIPSGTPVAGPSVTRYDFQLQPGVKLKKLMNAADDIALSMGVSGVRIAPIPNKKSVVEIEVPNSQKTPVLLRDVLESRDFIYSSPSTFALGRGIDGEIVTGDFADIPHILIAGTTGSGKSVLLNSMIISLMYKAAPEDLRLLMIDPKQVELSPYNGIPHLSQPVVTSPAQAVAALQQAAIGMDTRYKTFADCGAKELSDYNRDAKSPLPRLVIVIDELADLMMTSRKDIEDSIIRIAQKGRAAGIHLVIATQRPSADVITGLMKSNISNRIALTVTSALESRIILDCNGAEKLTSNGDMLYAPTGGEKRRVQGCYVSPEEIEKVTAFLRRAGE